MQNTSNTYTPACILWSHACNTGDQYLPDSRTIVPPRSKVVYSDQQVCKAYSWKIHAGFVASGYVHTSINNRGTVFCSCISIFISFAKSSISLNTQSPVHIHKSYFLPQINCWLRHLNLFILIGKILIQWKGGKATPIHIYQCRPHISYIQVKDI